MFTVRAQPKHWISHSRNITATASGRARAVDRDGACFVDILLSLDFATHHTMETANENAVGIPRAIPWPVHV